MRLHLFRAHADSVLLAEWFVNVDDTARLHVQALVSPDIKQGERIWAVSERFTWNDIAAEVKKVSCCSVPLHLHKRMADADPARTSPRQTSSPSRATRTASTRPTSMLRALRSC
jgi:nucleoside-diphosphate-sugar epimerase